MRIGDRAGSWAAVVATGVFLASCGAPAPAGRTSKQTRGAISSGCVVAPDNLVAWWPGDGNTRDIIGGNDGTLMNGASFGPGMVGQAFSFDGYDDFVQVPDNSLWNFGSNDFSIDLWANFNYIKPSSNGAPAAVFIGHDEGPFNQNKWFFAYGGGLLEFHINSPTLGPIFIASYSANLVPGQWYFLTVTKHGFTYTIYLNGAPVSTQDDPNPIPTASAPLTIGQAESDPTHFERFFMNGFIDEVEVFHRALSASEVQGLYASGPAGKCKYVPVTIEIKPGSTGAPPINLRSRGVLPVAVLSTPSFDATTMVDVSSLRLGDPLLAGVAAPFRSSFQDVNGDGLLDLVVDFSVPDMVSVDAIGPASTELVLTGTTTASPLPIQGSEAVTIVPKK